MREHRISEGQVYEESDDNKPYLYLGAGSRGSVQMASGGRASFSERVGNFVREITPQRLRPGSRSSESGKKGTCAYEAGINAS